jgi:hypothetical protein
VRRARNRRPTRFWRLHDQDEVYTELGFALQGQPSLGLDERW